MALLLRIILVLIPIVAVLAWLRWRMKRDLDEEVRLAEFKRLKISFVCLTVVLLFAGLGLRFLNDTSGNVDEVYVPARVENGVLIPGKFVPKEELEAQNPNPAKPQPSPEEDDPEGVPDGGGAGAS